MKNISTIQKDILNRILDSYERRNDYGSSTKSARRTMLNINKKTYPDYFHVSSSSFRLMFNEEMKALGRENLVILQWEKFNEGESIEKVILNEEALPLIYSLLKRPTKKEIYRETTELLEKIKAGSPPDIKKFYDLLIKRLEELQPLPPTLRVDKPGEMLDTLRGLNYLFREDDEEITKRELSVTLYGDSKRFQQLEKGILQLYRRYFLTDGEDSGFGGDEGTSLEVAEEDSALLSEKGIVDNPLHIRLAGPLQIDSDKKLIDLSLFKPDMGLPAAMVQSLDIISCPAEKVIVIENLTAFYQYLRKSPHREIIVYSGGFIGRSLRILLQKFYNFSKEKGVHIPFYFWGDIDLGGFRIWHNLREKTQIPFEPFMMDEETYLKHLALGHPLPEKYIAMLQPLLQKEEFTCFHPLIKLITEKKIRVEQEAISLQGDKRDRCF